MSWPEFWRGHHRIGHANGVAVYWSAVMKDGDVIATRLAGAPGPAIFIGTRPLTEIEFAGLEGRYIVRRGMADVLKWCGQEVGPPPSRTGNGRRLYEQLVAASTTPPTKGSTDE